MHQQITQMRTMLLQHGIARNVMCGERDAHLVQSVHSLKVDRPHILPPAHRSRRQLKASLLLVLVLVRSPRGS